MYVCLDKRQVKMDNQSNYEWIGNISATFCARDPWIWMCLYANPELNWRLKWLTFSRLHVQNEMWLNWKTFLILSGR